MSKKSNRKSPRLTNWLALEHLEAREVPAVITFQQGVNSYTGTQDTVLFNQTPNTTYGLDSFLNIDQQDVSGVRQGLMRFDGIFGSGTGQIPFGSKINSATLTLDVTNESNSTMVLSFYRMNVNWNEANVTWNNFNSPAGQLGGVQISEGEAAGTPDAFFLDPSISTEVIDVKTSVQAWALGESNFGWFMESGSTNGIDIESSNAASDQPLLTVDYTPPTGTGQLFFPSKLARITEGDTGSKIFNLPVGLAGGTLGATVNYTVTGGSATGGGTDYTLASGSLTFTSYEQYIPIDVAGDKTIEGPETVTITLDTPSGATISQFSTDFTIADDDLLINEVFANVSNTGTTPDETNFEYIELLGAPNATIPADTYFVVFEGEEEEASGTVLTKNGVGRADLVFNLSGHTFGSNGLLVIRPTVWNFAANADAATTQVISTQLDKSGGVLEDSSQTYAIIMSTTPIIAGFDYDADSYNLISTDPFFSEETGSGIGVLELLPSGARFVDSVGYNEGGSGDRDRISFTAHPGIRIFQPEGFSEGSSPDGISRLDGFRDPNSTGAWFNGDVRNSANRIYAPRPQAYANNPLGAALTPGSANQLPVVNFKITSATVNENAGTVALVVQRGGITNVEAKVSFATADGTAKAGVTGDYIAQTGQLTFAPGDNEEIITITLNNDTLPEANELFSVSLNSALSPFVIDGNLTKMEITLLDDDAITKSFQNGVNGYVGTQDTYLTAWNPTLVNGADTDVILDAAYRNGFVGSQDRPTQALLRFDDIFGAGANQVPVGAQVFGGFVRLFVTNFTGASAEIRFHQMLQNWDEGATWEDPLGGAGSAILNGINPDNVEAAANPDVINPFPNRTQYVDIPIPVDTLSAWSNGTKANYGWLLTTDSQDEYLFNTSEEFFDPTARPQIFVAYQNPTGLGTFRTGDVETIVGEDNGVVAGTAQIPILRVGGSGAATLKYTITPTTGSGSDIGIPLTGTIPFAANTISTYLNVPVTLDGTRETNERFTITIESDSVPLTIDRATTTLTIRDNDYNALDPAQRILFNEIYTNSPGQDAPREYAEFVGAPGVGLGSLFFMTIEGDAGIVQGTTQVATDISTFSNGSNGITVITSTQTPGYTIDPAATRIGDTELDTTNTNQNRTFRDNSASFVLIYSPDATISSSNHDYDWDNNGTLELPAGAIIVDGAATLDDTGSDRIYLSETGTTPVTMAISKAQGTGAVVGPDVIARFRGNVTPKLPSGFFSGDLINNGDDPLLLNTAQSFGLASVAVGASGTPGYQNPGTAAESPLVSLISIGTTFGPTQRSRIAGLTLNFSGTVNNVLAVNQTGTPALRLTDQLGNAIVGVNVSVGGVFSNTITFNFSGPGLQNGSLFDGKYRLTVSGQSIIANGRAVDAANNGTSGSNLVFDFHKLFGDVTGEGTIDGNDLTAFGNAFGTNDPIFDQNNDGTVDGNDLTEFGNRFGITI